MIRLAEDDSHLHKTYILHHNFLQSNSILRWGTVVGEMEAAIQFGGLTIREVNNPHSLHAELHNTLKYTNPNINQNPIHHVKGLRRTFHLLHPQRSNRNSHRVLGGLGAPDDGSLYWVLRPQPGPGDLFT
jgi:hypothetical protein